MQFFLYKWRYVTEAFLLILIFFLGFWFQCKTEKLQS